MKTFVGQRYRHYKGGEYTVLAIARMERDSSEMCVVYRADYETEFGIDSVWIRPIKDFEADIEVEGRTVSRFTPIELI